MGHDGIVEGVAGCGLPFCQCTSVHGAFTVKEFMRPKPITAPDAAVAALHVPAADAASGNRSSDRK